MKYLNLLGCVPTLLNVQTEVSFESSGYRSFFVHQNVPIDSRLLNKFYEKDPRFKVEFGSVNNKTRELIDNEKCCFSVVGTHTKSIVFKVFENDYGLKKYQFVNILHPTSYVSNNVELDSGLFLEPNSTISSRTSIGFGVNIKRNCSIGHHCEIEDYVTINPGVVMSGEVKIGRSTMLGSGVIIRDKVVIGKNSLIGAGSVVVSDIPNNVIAFGNPCKVVRENISS